MEFLAAAQTLIILTAGIDLSVAAMMVLASVFMGKLSVEMGIPTLPAIMVGMISGVATGAFNGLLVTRLRLPPFIVTLGTWNIFFALVIFFTGSQSIRSSDIEINAPLLHFWGERINLGGFVFTLWCISYDWYICLFVVFTELRQHGVAMFML